MGLEHNNVHRVEQLINTYIVVEYSIIGIVFILTIKYNQCKELSLFYGHLYVQRRMIDHVLKPVCV